MLTQLTDALTTLITNLYVSTGLIGIIVAMAVESCCIPLPSEIVMPLAGVMFVSGKLLSGTNSVVGLVLIALAGAIGCLIGSIAAYGIGYSGGRPLMLKYGRYLLISQHDADKADHFFQKWGSATAFFSRLLPVIRTYISLPAGIAKMPFVKFCIYTVIGSFLWSLLLAYIGTIIGGNLAKLSSIFHSLDVVILVVLVVLVALYIWRHVRNDRKARVALATSQVAPLQSPPPQQSWGQQPPSPQQYQQQGQPQPQQQQSWQQPSQQPDWNQPPQQFQSPTPQLGWKQPLQSPPPFQPPQSPGWHASSPPQQGWGQQPPTWPTPNSDNDRTVRHS